MADIALPQVLLGRIQGHRWPKLIDSVEQRELAAPVPPSTECPEAIGQQIGRTRQLLLWSATHFVHLRQFLDWMQWTNDGVALFRPATLDPRLVRSAHENGLDALRGCRSNDGRKGFQIDVASESRAGMTTVRFPDRVAAVVGDANPVAADNYEFLLLWLAFRLTQQQGPERTAPDAQASGSAQNR